MSHTSVKQECFTRALRNSVKQGCPTRVSPQCVNSGCLTSDFVGNATNKYCLCLSTYVSAFGFVGFILFFTIFTTFFCFFCAASASKESGPTASKILRCFHCWTWSLGHRKHRRTTGGSIPSSSACCGSNGPRGRKWASHCWCPSTCWKCQRPFQIWRWEKSSKVKVLRLRWKCICVFLSFFWWCLFVSICSWTCVPVLKAQQTSGWPRQPCGPCGWRKSYVQSCALWDTRDATQSKGPCLLDLAPSFWTTHEIV